MLEQSDIFKEGTSVTGNELQRKCWKEKLLQ